MPSDSVSEKSTTMLRVTPSARSSTNPSTDRAYTGQRENMELGLYYYNARYYVPGLERFLSADTIVPDPADPQSFNRYSYVNNNPVNDVDPTGTGTVVIASIVICGVVIIVGLILTINCFSKWARFGMKARKIGKECDECSTQDIWNKATATKEYKDMIKACGMPSPGA